MSTKVKTGVVRLNFPKLFEAESFKNDPNAEKRYSTGMIIPKEDTATFNALKQAFEEAKENSKAKFGANKSVQSFKFIKHSSDERGLLLDCDEDPDKSEDPTFQGCYYLNAATKEKNGAPGVVVRKDGALVHIEDPEQVYSGCYAKVMVNLYAYTAGRGGISAGLGNVLKVRDGERLGGRSSAEADFADETDEDDVMLYTD